MVSYPIQIAYNYHACILKKINGNNKVIELIGKNFRLMSKEGRTMNKWQYQGKNREVGNNRNGPVSVQAFIARKTNIWYNFCMHCVKQLARVGKASNNYTACVFNKV